ncbi:MAG: hypothetical protein KatS3mg110_4477 [Pirellulaceae bacterium]|nr:MAG: hypothetical protein KatS3mg110_4477 [Pirellulaceae bacterium]
MTDTGGEPKIIVDEDWKARVEREREQLRQQEQQKVAGAETRPDEDDMFIPPPPASFAVLVEWLAAQALAQLAGSLPSAQPESETERFRQKKRAEQARLLAGHFIDLLGVLEEKTEGNRSAEESRLISQRLHELRLAFVETLQRKDS